MSWKHVVLHVNIKLIKMYMHGRCVSSVKDCIILYVTSSAYNSAVMHQLLDLIYLHCVPSSPPPENSGSTHAISWANNTLILDRIDINIILYMIFPNSNICAPQKEYILLWNLCCQGHDSKARPWLLRPPPASKKIISARFLSSTKVEKNWKLDFEIWKYYVSVLQRFWNESPASWYLKS